MSKIFWEEFGRQSKEKSQDYTSAYHFDVHLIEAVSPKFFAHSSSQHIPDLLNIHFLIFLSDALDINRFPFNFQDFFVVLFPSQK